MLGPKELSNAKIGQCVTFCYVYYIEQISYVYYIVTQFSHLFLKAKPRSCPYLPAPDKGTVALTGGTSPGSVATYRCKLGYILVGEATRSCRDTGQWTGQAPYCRGPQAIVILP